MPPTVMVTASAVLFVVAIELPAAMVKPCASRPSWLAWIVIVPGPYLLVIALIVLGARFAARRGSGGGP